MKTRNEKGQFIGNGQTATYKQVMFNGVQMVEHRRKLCMILGVDNLPKGFIVHHIDGNKKNNNINNLAIMTMTAHNRIHSHEPWNKGLTAKEDKKLEKTLRKALSTRKGNYYKKAKDVYAFKQAHPELSLRGAAKQYGVTHQTFTNRYNFFKEYENIRGME